MIFQTAQNLQAGSNFRLQVVTHPDCKFGKDFVQNLFGVFQLNSPQQAARSEVSFISATQTVTRQC